MKICTYCKSEIEDSCLQCPNCGASEFEHKCPVCGCSHKGGACPECTIQTASEVVGSVAVLTGRMKDMLSKVETNGGVENSKAENSKSENGEADLEMKGNGHVMIGGTRPFNTRPSTPPSHQPSVIQPSVIHPPAIQSPPIRYTARTQEDIPVCQNHPVYSSWHIFLSAGPCHNHNSDCRSYSHNR